MPLTGTARCVTTDFLFSLLLLSAEATTSTSLTTELI